jgi:hypothetical protein
MAFGQAGGPPATHQQVNALTELLLAAGFDGFREARHPYGLTQRQASGKFTRDEAAELIERLESELAAEPVDGQAPGPADATPLRAVARAATPGRARRGSVTDLSAVPDDDLVVELGRRGWICSKPF